MIAVADVEEHIKQGRRILIKRSAAIGALLVLSAAAVIAFATEGSFAVPGLDLRLEGRHAWVPLALLSVYFMALEWINNGKLALVLGPLIALSRRGVLSEAWKIRWESSSLSVVQLSRPGGAQQAESGHTGPLALVGLFARAMTIPAWLFDHGTTWIFGGAVIAGTLQTIEFFSNVGLIHWWTLVIALMGGLVTARVLKATPITEDEIWGYIKKKEMLNEVMRRAKALEEDLGEHGSPPIEDGLEGTEGDEQNEAREGQEA